MQPLIQLEILTVLYLLEFAATLSFNVFGFFTVGCIFTAYYFLRDNTCFQRQKKAVLTWTCKRWLWVLSLNQWKIAPIPFTMLLGLFFKKKLPWLVAHGRLSVFYWELKCQLRIKWYMNSLVKLRALVFSLLVFELYLNSCNIHIDALVSSIQRLPDDNIWVALNSNVPQ